MMMYQVLVERFADVEISLGGHNDHAVHAARQSNLQTGEVNTMSIKVVIILDTMSISKIGHVRQSLSNYFRNL